MLKYTTGSSHKNRDEGRGRDGDRGRGSNRGKRSEDSSDGEHVQQKIFGQKDIKDYSLMDMSI